MIGYCYFTKNNAHFSFADNKTDRLTGFDKINKKTLHIVTNISLIHKHHSMIYYPTVIWMKTQINNVVDYVNRILESKIYNSICATQIIFELYIL